LKKEDWLFSTHRSHGHYLAKGGTEQSILDEIEGKETGINGGFSGSQSFCDVSLNFHSTAIVGGLLAPAVGTALALKMQHSDAIVVSCLGDGATEQGVFWEALNFASLHSLPIVWVCESNGLSVHAPIRARQCSPIIDRVRSFRVDCFNGIDGLKTVLRKRIPALPAFVKVPCERQCAHVSAMEDCRE
jgi:pyruvate dehydrogenase E1 component alpha subunit